MEFLLTAVYDVLCEIADTEQVTAQVTEQVKRLIQCMGNEEYSTKELIELLRLKHRPAFREKQRNPYQ